jgi:hypothetical protein
VGDDDAWEVEVDAARVSEMITAQVPRMSAG